MGFFTKIYLYIRELFGYRKDILDDDEVMHLRWKLEALGKEIDKGDPNSPLTTEELAKYDAILEEIASKCGSRQPGLYESTIKDRKNLKKAMDNTVQNDHP